MNIKRHYTHFRFALKIKMRKKKARGLMTVKQNVRARIIKEENHRDVRCE
jgi:hypothetical protein